MNRKGRKVPKKELLKSNLPKLMTWSTSNKIPRRQKKAALHRGIDSLKYNRTKFLHPIH